MESTQSQPRDRAPLAPTSIEVCSGCQEPLQGKRRYQLKNGRELATRCMSCALVHAPLLWRSARIAAVVGSFLVALNQGDKLPGLLEGMPPEDLVWKVPLTYAVPFCVATYGALGNAQREDPDDP